MKEIIKTILVYLLILTTVYYFRSQSSNLGIYKEEYCTGNLTISNGTEVPFATTDERDQADQLQSSMISIRGTNQMKTAIQNNDIPAYILSFMYIAMAFLILAVLGFFIFFFEFICCACDKQKWCPLCSSWRRDIIEKPYTGCCDLTCPAYLVILFSLLIVGSTVFVYVQASQDIDPGFKAAKCSTFALFDDLLYGDPAQTWLGFQQAIVKLKNYKTKLHNSINDIQFYFGNQDWVDTDSQALYAMLADVQTNFGSKQIALSPNPLSAGSPSNSKYLNTLLGDSTVSGTTLFLIKSELDIKIKALSEQIKLMNQKAIDVITQQGSIVEAIDSANVMMGQTSIQIVQLQSNLDDYWKQADSYLGYFFDFQMYVYGVIGGLGLLQLLGAGFTHCAEKPVMRYFGVIQKKTCLMLAGSFQHRS